MNIKIRKAKKEDLKKIQELNLLLFKKEYKYYDKTLDLHWTFGKEGTKYFKGEIEKEGRCAFVAVLKDKIAGYLVGGLSKAESYRILPQVAELDNMLVLKEYRNLKVGTKLYEEFMKWCKTKKVKLVRVVASSQNKKAINFYVKNGFNDHSLTLEKWL